MKKRKLDANNEADRQYVQSVWDMFDDDDISIERLIAMVADTCGIEYEDVLEFMYDEEIDKNTPF